MLFKESSLMNDYMPQIIISNVVVESLHLTGNRIGDTGYIQF